MNLFVLVFTLFIFFLLVLISFYLFFIHEGTIISSIRSSNVSKTVFLTFDDGPGPLTDDLLNILTKYDVSATFFLLGNRAKENPSLVRKILSLGNTIGAHSMTHPYIFFNPKKEIIGSKLLLENITNSSIKYFRAPYGFLTPQSILVAKRNNLTIVHWSCFPMDYATTSEKIVKRVKRCLKPGVIIVLHPWNHPQTINALPEIISYARSQGFVFESLK